MADRGKIFDSKSVQRNTRRRIAYHTGMFTATVVLAIGILLLLSSKVQRPVLWSCVVGGVFILPAVYLGYRIYRLSQIVWHIELSDHQVEGYDYARRKIYLSWNHIRRIELTGKKLTLTDRNGRVITLPAEFSAFVDVGHLVFDRAEENAIPLYVDGKSWETLDAQTLFPFLKGDKPAAL